MLGQIEYSMNDLFAQLGLENSDEAIEQFIATHQLPDHIRLQDADFWNDSQRTFLIEECKNDAVWAIVVEELNAQLHETE